MKKVIVFFANGTEEIEALTPVDYLRRAGADVTLAGVPEKDVTGSHGINISADKAARDCVNADFDMVVLPGGLPGTVNLEIDENVQKILRKAYDEGKYVCAICAAPSVLGKAGMLCGKHATCYPGFEEHLHGAVCEKAPVVCDGNVITSCGAGAAGEFAYALIRALYGEEKSEQIRKAVNPYV